MALFRWQELDGNEDLILWIGITMDWDWFPRDYRRIPLYTFDLAGSCSSSHFHWETTYHEEKEVYLEGLRLSRC